MAEIRLRDEGPFKITIDNKFEIDLANHPIAQGRNKHIETRFHLLRDQMMKDKLKLEHYSTNEQKTDILTNPLKRLKFQETRSE